uniref:Chloromuconate cycloisomerase n=1 Tax=Rhodococcus opacus TaxID=37919 RepID=UPI0004AC2187|nr:Chain A, Chloromuconate cycloisomerase [Rhodococcus opacus]4M0X_B Chain B, Chloromuconate cycloisomerase [Rhodococcus opacus]
MTTTITEMSATIVDLPSRRPHKFAATTMHHQSIVLVRVRDSDGGEGIGEAVTPGGPWWGGESVETIKTIIDQYLAPVIIGRDPSTIGVASQSMDGLVFGNSVAKAAIETALWDDRERRSRIPVSDLLGGLRRKRIPITWAFSAGSASDLIDEAAQKLDVGHRSFKFKMGAEPADTDSRRVLDVLECIPDECAVIVDPNGRWSELEAHRWLPILADAGVTVAEQPIARWNTDGLARLRDKLSIPIMADESVTTVQQAIALADAGAVSAFAIKIPKSGGLSRAREIAAIAEASGLACFGAATPESSVMGAISAQLYGTMPDLSVGCELFGPGLLIDEVVTEPLKYDRGELLIPTGPGSGVNLDEERLRKYSRD